MILDTPVRQPASKRTQRLWRIDWGISGKKKNVSDKRFERRLFFFHNDATAQWPHFDSNEDPSLKYTILFSVVQKPKFFLMKVCFSVWDGDYGGLVNKRRVFTHTHTRPYRQGEGLLPRRRTPEPPIHDYHGEEHAHTRFTYVHKHRHTFTTEPKKFLHAVQIFIIRDLNCFLKRE